MKIILLYVQYVRVHILYTFTTCGFTRNIIFLTMMPITTRMRVNYNCHIMTVFVVQPDEFPKNINGNYSHHNDETNCKKGWDFMWGENSGWRHAALRYYQRNTYVENLNLRWQRKRQQVGTWRFENPIGKLLLMMNFLNKPKSKDHVSCLFSFAYSIYQPKKVDKFQDRDRKRQSRRSCQNGRKSSDRGENSKFFRVSVPIHRESYIRRLAPRFALSSPRAYIEGRTYTFLQFPSYLPHIPSYSRHISSYSPAPSRPLGWRKRNIEQTQKSRDKPVHTSKSPEQLVI